MGPSPSPSAVASLSLLGLFLVLLVAGALNLWSSLSPDLILDQQLSQVSDENPYHALTNHPEIPDDWTPYRPDEGWEILEPFAILDEPDALPQLIDAPQPPTTATAPASSNRGSGNATLVVITNFSRADVLVNETPYPSYFDDGENRGVRLPARTEHEIRVNFDGRQKLYRVTLAPGERRLLMVELTGMRASDEPLPVRASARPVHEGNPDEADDVTDGPLRGQVTVYSRPQGTIYIGDRASGDTTPGTVEVEEGRHEVFVRYEDGEKSEPKVVRVRQGSRIKLFFRQDDE